MKSLISIDRSKWENFWYYYKMHVIAGIFVAVVLAMSLKDCANNITPDVNISYVGSGYMTEEVVQEFKDKLSDVIIDVNGDEKKEILFQVLTITDEKSEANFVVQQKAVAEMAVGDTKLYLLDKESYQIFGTQGAFEPLDDIAEKYGISAETDPDLWLKATGTNKEHIYALPLKGSLLLKELQIKDDDIYIALRPLSDKDKENQRKQQEYQNAKIIFEELLKK